jgi:hypothetical protein
MDWGEYTEGAGGKFFTESETVLLIASGETFAITGVRDGVSNYNGQSKPQWLVDVITQDGEERTKGLSKGIDERDARITRLKATLEATGEPISARFVKVGRRIDITGA